MTSIGDKVQPPKRHEREKAEETGGKIEEIRYKYFFYKANFKYEDSMCSIIEPNQVSTQPAWLFIITVL